MKQNPMYDDFADQLTNHDFEEAGITIAQILKEDFSADFDYMDPGDLDEFTGAFAGEFS